MSYRSLQQYNQDPMVLIQESYQKLFPQETYSGGSFSLKSAVRPGFTPQYDDNAYIASWQGEKPKCGKCNYQFRKIPGVT